MKWIRIFYIERIFGRERGLVCVNLCEMGGEEMWKPAMGFF